MAIEDQIKAIDEKIRAFRDKHGPDLNLVYVIEGDGTRYNYHSRKELRVKIAPALESSKITSLDTLFKKDTNHMLKIVAFRKELHPSQNLYVPGQVREELYLNKLKVHVTDPTPVEGKLDADKIERYYEQKGWKPEFGYLRKRTGDTVLRLKPSTTSFRIEIGMKQDRGMEWKHYGGGYYKDFYINEKGMLVQRKKQ
jgi:hypothetical protein